MPFSPLSAVGQALLNQASIRYNYSTIFAVVTKYQQKKRLLWIIDLQYQTIRLLDRYYGAKINR